MKKRFNLAAAFVFFVIGAVSCSSPEALVNGAVNETIQEQVTGSPPEILPVPTPEKVSRGQSTVAVGDRGLWKEAVNTPEGFDRASRAAILQYALELGEQQAAEDSDGKRPSVVKWLDNELNRARQNYNSATRTCPANDWTCVGEANNSKDFTAKVNAQKVPPALAAWRRDMAQFVQIYVAEQVRLASLFPATTSEIDTFNDNEWIGDEVSDRKFFLTFDDGPTAAKGETDGVLEMLAAQKKTAVFFVLGLNFSNRLRSDKSLAELYSGQCVGAHGWEHISHQKRSKYAAGDRWQTSVTDSIALISKNFSGTNSFLPLFRPPYGQRKPDSGAFFQKEGLQVALWNMDSQDWNEKIVADDIINRMEILMLIKRRGVLLFHDIHPKAKIAVPVIISDFGNAVEWGDCRQIS